MITNKIILYIKKISLYITNFYIFLYIHLYIHVLLCKLIFKLSLYIFIIFYLSCYMISFVYFCNKFFIYYVLCIMYYVFTLYHIFIINIFVLFKYNLISLLLFRFFPYICPILHILIHFIRNKRYIFKMFSKWFHVILICDCDEISQHYAKS